ncbi:hypothetical protein [Oceanobacillus luteolus]|uniref:Uncharacterized protein n=1 Tax=Oceanobacillus luteolus TaxID=1274358 RepID=A0ABW4HXJ7_9BACI
MEFNPKAMARMVENDMYLSFVFVDLTKRNPNSSERDILEIVYNANVAEDNVYSYSYQEELNKINEG